MRKRTLYLSELILRYKGKDINFVIWYNNNAVKYHTSEDVRFYLSETDLWNMQVKYWTLEHEIISIYL